MKKTLIIILLVILKNVSFSQNSIPSSVDETSEPFESFPDVEADTPVDILNAINIFQKI